MDRPDSSPPIPAIHEAARTRDVDAIDRLLAADGSQASVALGPECNDTPLHTAARHGSGAVVGALLRHGVDVNARGGPNADVSEGGRGMTPLHYAAYFGRPDVAEQLLEAGANIEASDEAGLTPVQAAYMGIGRLESWDVAAKLANRGTALDLNTAIWLDKLDVARALLEQGPESRRHAIAPDRLLLEGARLSRRLTSGVDLRRMGVEVGVERAIEMLELLFARGVPRAREYEALHIAVQIRHPAIASLLLEHGVDPTPPDSSPPAPSLLVVAQSNRTCGDQRIGRDSGQQEVVRKKGTFYFFERMLPQSNFRLISGRLG